MHFLKISYFGDLHYIHNNVIPPSFVSYCKLLSPLYVYITCLCHEMSKSLLSMPMIYLFCFITNFGNSCDVFKNFSNSLNIQRKYVCKHSF